MATLPFEYVSSLPTLSTTSMQILPYRCAEGLPLCFTLAVYHLDWLCERL